ncbi:AraC family transcriptional regulator [Pseudomonas juntendi]|nr:AraC family transcriptional regulator [Pseudomonas juntendi]
MHDGTPQMPLQPPGALTPARLRLAKELMLRSSLSIIEIAGLCNLTRSHFSRAFKVNTGLSPRPGACWHAWKRPSACLPPRRPLPT